MTRLRPVRAALLLALLLSLFAASPLSASEPGARDPLVAVFFTLVLVLFAGRVGGDLAVRAGQPEVLGELLAGVVIGNLGLAGFHALDYVKDDQALTMLAGIGVVLLLFQVGLESTIADMRKVGASSFLVATVGVVAPSLLGWGASAWFHPDSSMYVHLFIGTTLCATSVGITARVFQDLGRSRDLESRIVLGAAVIDDVMGLIVLAVVTGLVAAAAAGTTLSAGSLLVTTATAVGFLVGAIVIGRLAAPGLFRAASYLRAKGGLLAVTLGFCFLLSGLAGMAGLAPIVGAFAAGLLLEDVHFQHFRKSEPRSLEDLVQPIVTWLAPFFFVQMGARVDLAHFGDASVLGFAAVLTVAAIAGKQACALGVLEEGGNRLAVGIGMIPRGEVGLIFAQIGHSLTIGEERVIDDATFGAVVMMVMVTTVVTPGLLKWSMGRRGGAGEAEPSPPFPDAPRPPPGSTR